MHSRSDIMFKPPSEFLVCFWVFSKWGRKLPKGGVLEASTPQLTHFNAEDQ